MKRILDFDVKYEGQEGDPLADTGADPDDVELEKTPEDVIRLLGFDPKEFSEEEE